MSEKAKYEGRVIAVTERNGYDDSDFLALVESDAGGFGWITTGSTAYGGGWIATPNATEEVKARYAEWYAGRKAVAEAAQAAYDERVVKVGSEVRVVGGRKHKGQSGVVVWFGKDQYKSTRTTEVFRVGIQPADGGEKFFVPVEQVEVSTSSGWAEPANRLTSALNPRPSYCSPEWFVFSEFPAPR